MKAFLSAFSTVFRRTAVANARAVPRFPTNLARLVPRTARNAKSTTGCGCSRFLAATSAPSLRRPKAVFLNASRLNYDGKLDFSDWHKLIDVDLHDSDRVVGIPEILRLIPDGTEIVLTKEMTVPAEAVRKLPRSVQLLCECGTGYNNIPVDVARNERHITVCNVPSYSNDAVAHTAITYLLNFSASVFQQQHLLRCEKDRRNFTGPFSLPLHEVNGKVLGLVGGSGRIGTKVAQIALALGMHVIVGRRPGSNVTLSPSHELAPLLVDITTTNGGANATPFIPGKVSCTDNLHDILLPNADYVSIHTPLNDASRHSFGRAELHRMKNTAFLINTSRGAVVDEKALIEVLRAGNIIAGAGLDVTEREPPEPNSPLYDLSNVYLSPHTGWRRLETRQRLVDYTAETLRAYCTARSPADYKNVVN
jgi:glycerate dehydrogenase